MVRGTIECVAGDLDHDLNLLCAHWVQMNAVQRERQNRWGAVSILTNPWSAAINRQFHYQGELHERHRRLAGHLR
jgi:hypothetical protein